MEIQWNAIPRLPTRSHRGSLTFSKTLGPSRYLCECMLEIALTQLNLLSVPIEPDYSIFFPSEDRKANRKRNMNRQRVHRLKLEQPSLGLLSFTSDFFDKMCGCAYQREQVKSEAPVLSMDEEDNSIVETISRQPSFDEEFDVVELRDEWQPKTVKKYLFLDGSNKPTLQISSDASCRTETTASSSIASTPTMDSVLSTQSSHTLAAFDQPIFLSHSDLSVSTYDFAKSRRWSSSHVPSEDQHSDFYRERNQHLPRLVDHQRYQC